MISASVVALFASATLVAGHGWISDVVIDGKNYAGAKNWNSPDNINSPVRGVPNNLGFLNHNSYGDNNMACGVEGNKPTNLTPSAPAGSVVGVRWGGDGGPDGKQWPHPEGPIISYLASCNGECKNFNPAGAMWFKIKEEGLDTSKRPNPAGNTHTPAGDGLWAQNRIQYEDSWDWVTIPGDLKAGEYLLRHEMISLHGAHTAAEGPQNYPQCVQLKITGGGDANPATTHATQLYKPSESLTNIYEPYPAGIKNYKIPGPPLYVPGKASNPAPAPTSTPAPTSSDLPATSAPAATSADPTSKPAANNNNNAPASTPAPKPTSGGSKTCKAKRAKRDALRDESRAVYDRALAGAKARRAHGIRRSTH